MKLTIEQQIGLYGEQLFLEFQKKDQKEALPHKKDYSSDVAFDNAYINKLCLNLVAPKLQEELELEDAPKIWPDEESLPTIWEFVNGSAIIFNNIRLVLIPQETLETDELLIPREWVDLPNWKGDYYLGIDVNWQEGLLRVWGYSDYQTVSKNAVYDPIELVYKLEAEQLVTDLQLILLTEELKQNPLPQRVTQPSIPGAILTSALEQFSKPSLYSPRFDADPDLWSAVLDHDNWRNNLYQRRLKNNPIANVSNLSEWLKRNISASWETVESLLAKKQSANQTSPQRKSESKTEVEKEIALSTRLIANETDIKERFYLGLNLSKIDPNNHLAAIRRAKTFDFVSGTIIQKLALFFAIMPRQNQSLDIFVEVRSMEDYPLPEGFKLRFFKAESEIIDVKLAESTDKSVKGYFECNFNENFFVELSSGDTIITTEEFVWPV